MKLKTLIYCSFVMLLNFSACSESREKVIARVYDAKLTSSDLQKMQADFEVNSDSMEINPAIVEAWIEKQTLVEAAKRNLSSKEKKFDKELQDYYEALIVNAYENKIVERHLNKNVSNREILDYYKQHKEDFEMHKNIVKINYAKFPKNITNTDEIRKLLQKGKNRSATEQSKLEKYCYEHAENMYLDFNWLVFDDILKEIPLETYNQEQFLLKNKSIECEDSSSIYIVQILDYKINESYSPVELEKENIKKLILNRRRLVLLEQLRKECLEKARKEHEINTILEQ